MHLLESVKGFSFSFCVDSVLWTLMKVRLFCSIVFSVSVLLSRFFSFPFCIDLVPFDPDEGETFRSSFLCLSIQC